MCVNLFYIHLENINNTSCLVNYAIQSLIIKPLHMHFICIITRLSKSLQTEVWILDRCLSWTNGGWGVVDGEVEAVLNFSNPSYVHQTDALSPGS